MQENHQPISDKYLALAWLKKEDCHYRSVTVKDFYNRYGGYAISHLNIDELEDKNLIVQINDEREHVGTTAYAVFPKLMMETMIRNHINKSTSENGDVSYAFDLKDILPIAPIFFVKHGELGSKMVIRRMIGLKDFNYLDTPIKICE